MTKLLRSFFTMMILVLVGAACGTDEVRVEEIDGKRVTSIAAEWKTTTNELVAGTLTCSLSGCDTDRCRRSGCEPKADKSGCTACSCTGPWTCQPCVCEQTFEVDTPAAPGDPLPVFENSAILP